MLSRWMIGLCSGGSEAAVVRRCWLSLGRLRPGLVGLVLAGVLTVQAAPLLVDGVAAEVLDERIAGSNAWLEIDRGAFEANLLAAMEHLDGRAQVCAIMKADAYGNGLSGLLPIVMEHKVPFIGITSNEEARIVRGSGYEGRVIRVRSAPRNEIEAGIPYEIEEIIGSVDQAMQVIELSETHGRAIGVHLALNSTGMGRNGLELGTESGKEAGLTIVSSAGLKVVGIMTHFPRSSMEKITEGIARFEEETQWLLEHSELRREDLIFHVASSYAAMNVPEALFDMVRLGGVLYGRNAPYNHIVTFKTRVASLHDFPAGSTVGYGNTAVLARDSVLANLPLGYTDGLARTMSNRGYVLINGKRAPVIGVTSMNTTMVDVTDIPTARANDEVVIFGTQGEEKIGGSENRARTERTLSEQVAIWAATNPRVYY